MFDFNLPEAPLECVQHQCWAAGGPGGTVMGFREAGNRGGGIRGCTAPRTLAVVVGTGIAIDFRRND